MAPKRLSASGKSSAHRDTSRAQQGSATGQPTMRSAFVQSLLFAKPSAPGARTLLNTVSKEEHQQKMEEETVALKRRAEEAKEEVANKQKRRLSAERSAVGQPGLVHSRVGAFCRSPRRQHAGRAGSGGSAGTRRGGRGRDGGGQ
mmetsp:Transcript_29438/g.94195  ORF Transcript_29438/g.94195 Transcript_29438/m.94195 type:complete len:145 (-) Transcript_29438:958-1392(-)